MPAAIVRRAGAADAAALAALAELAFRQAFAAQNAPADIDAHCARHFGPEFQLREIADPALATHLAEVSGRLAGFSQLRMLHATEYVACERPAELNRIYVAADWHGGGIAHELMRNVFATAAGGACDRVWLGVWERNDRAIAFYRKWGFHVVGEHTFLLGRDPQRDLIMVARVG